MAKTPEKSFNPYELGRLCHWLITIAGIGFFAALFDPLVETLYRGNERYSQPQPNPDLTPVAPNLQQVAALVSSQIQLRYTITDHEWVALQTRDAIPPNAFAVGYEGSGQPLVLCRAVHLGINRPGKVVDGYCNVAVFEADPPLEVTKEQYEVLVTAQLGDVEVSQLKWISRQAHSQIPEAYVLFSDHSTVICRASHVTVNQALGKHPGMIYRDRCVYPYADQVFAAADYEVLTVNVD